MNKKELVAQLAPLPDDAEIDVEIIHSGVSITHDVTGVQGFDEKFGYITLIAR